MYRLNRAQFRMGSTWVLREQDIWILKTRRIHGGVAFWNYVYSIEKSNMHVVNKYDSREQELVSNVYVRTRSPDL